MDTRMSIMRGGNANMIWLPHIIGGLGLILIAIIIATSIALRIISKKERKRRDWDHGEDS